MRYAKTKAHIEALHAALAAGHTIETYARDRAISVGHARTIERLAGIILPDQTGRTRDKKLYVNKGIDWDTELRAAVASGETTVALARRLGVHKTSVRDAIRSRGIVLPRATPGRPPKRGPKGIDWDTELRAAVAAGETASALARRLRVHQWRVDYATRRRGIVLPRATPGRPPSRQQKPAEAPLPDDALLAWRRRVDRHALEAKAKARK